MSLGSHESQINLKTVPSTFSISGLPQAIVRCRSLALDVSLLLITVLLVALNQAYLTFYFVLFGQEHKGKYLDTIITSDNCSDLEELRESEYSLQYIGWVAGDLISVLAMVTVHHSQFNNLCLCIIW